MANKIYDETTIQNIASAIRSKNGSTATYKVREMAAAINAIQTGAQAQTIEWHQCPELPRNFVANVTYDPDDYTTSQIDNYAPDTPLVSNYKPIGKTVDGTTFYNQEPNKQTAFATNSSFGTLKPLDKVRYINTPSAPNVRDIGGWACDGGTVKYGKLFRGGFLSASDRAVCVDELGIMHDLDLRGTTEANLTVSPLGNDIHYTCAPNYNWYSITNTNDWRINLRTVFDAVTHNEPLYFHCSAGSDRTGTLACVLEGLLGMSQSDIDKDYELASFYNGAGTDLKARRRNETEWKGLINAIKQKSGNTFADKCATFAVELGFTAAEINAYRKAMIDGTPSTVSPSISTYTITQNLTQVANSNSATNATQYQPYNCNITPAIGYAISSVQIKMDGFDITRSAWSGNDTILRRKVIQTLSNASSNNTTISVIDGQGYAAEIAPMLGYTLENASISIKMGGTEMSSQFYKSGTIAIPKVTGNLEITITAIESAPEHENLIKLSTDNWTSNIFNSGLGYKSGYRYNSSFAETALSNPDVGTKGKTFITGMIPISKGQNIRLENCWIDLNGQAAEYGGAASEAGIGLFKADSTTVYTGWKQNSVATSGTEAAKYMGNLVYDSTNSNIIIGWTWLDWITVSNVSGAKFTLFSNDPSKAMMYIEETEGEQTDENNLIPLSTRTDGSGEIYGYVANSRYKSDRSVVSATPGSVAAMFTTGLIPVAVGEKVRLKNCWIDPNATEGNYPQNAGGANCFGVTAEYELAYNGQFSWISTSMAAYCKDYVYDSNNYVIGWTWNNYIDTRSIVAVAFTLAANDPSKAVYYIEE